MKRSAGMQSPPAAEETEKRKKAGNKKEKERTKDKDKKGILRQKKDDKKKGHGRICRILILGILKQNCKEINFSQTNFPDPSFGFLR